MSKNKAKSALLALLHQNSFKSLKSNVALHIFATKVFKVLKYTLKLVLAYYSITQWQGFGLVKQMLIVQICLEQFILILSIIKFYSFFCKRIRNSLLFDNYKKLFSFGKLEFFLTRARFFGSGLSYSSRQV